VDEKPGHATITLKLVSHKREKKESRMVGHQRSRFTLRRSKNSSGQVYQGVRLPNGCASAEHRCAGCSLTVP